MQAKVEGREDQLWLTVLEAMFWQLTIDFATSSVNTEPSCIVNVVSVGSREVQVESKLVGMNAPSRLVSWRALFSWSAASLAYRVIVSPTFSMIC